MNKKTKVVWITGASSGIGAELARQYSNLGVKLILSSRRADVLGQVKSDCCNPENIKILPFDLIDFKSVSELVKLAYELFGTIDILINNAGISQRSLIIDTDFEVYKRLIEINYLGQVAISNAILPYFIKQGGGSFAIISSVMGKYSSPYRSGYAAAKHALHGFFDTLRMEHQNDNIFVTIICPGFVNTSISKNSLTGDGTPLGQYDRANARGLSVELSAKKIISAVDKKKWEISFGGKERMGVYLKRLSNKLLHYIVKKSNVR
jgi:short-subunit dehydrogenase